MDLDKTLKKINSNREKAEACFVFSLWKNPELYADYMNLNTNNDKTLQDEDAIFYFALGREMYKNGFRSFDSITLDTFLSNKPKIKKKFNEYGGISEVEQLKNLVNTDNVDAYFDVIAKKNSLSILAKKYEEIFDNIERFENATNEDVYNTFDLLNSSVSVATGNDVKIEELVLDDKFIKSCEEGTARGLDYGKNCPILNYITLGIPRGDLTMFAAHSGMGKSSFVFENIVISLIESGIKVAIISNEMRAEQYKNMLLVHILVNDLNYWGLTRKKVKMGGFSDEQKEMIEKAIDIQKKKYSGITFVKMFDNDTSKVTKYMRKLAYAGNVLVVYDTMKGDDEVDEQMWQRLIVNSRKIFQIASKYNIAIVTTYQLSLHTQNQRYLDSGCLSQSKQIKEIFSELLYFRILRPDEYPGEKYDCHPHILRKTESGKYIKEEVCLDAERKHIVFFVDKTRSDDSAQQILYEFNPRFNKWKEIGHCTIFNDYR